MLIGTLKVDGSSDSKILIRSDSLMSTGWGMTSVWQIFMKTFWDDMMFLVLTQKPASVN